MTGLYGNKVRGGFGSVGSMVRGVRRCLVLRFISSLTYFEVRQRICNELPDHFSSC